MMPERLCFWYPRIKEIQRFGREVEVSGMNIRGGNWLEGSYSGGFSVISNSRIATGDHVSVGGVWPFH